jgi:hypothetical protein
MTTAHVFAYYCLCTDPRSDPSASKYRSIEIMIPTISGPSVISNLAFPEFLACARAYNAAPVPVARVFAGLLVTVRFLAFPFVAFLKHAD